MKTIKTTLKIALLLLIFISCSDDEQAPKVEQIVTDATVDTEVGGANEPNQVYFDFSSNTQTDIQRDSWDLRFYSGDTFRVSLNTSIAMATKQLATTDLNSVTTATVQSLFTEVTTQTFDANNVAFVDDFDGDINNTAITEISDMADNNKVYLLNLGYAIGTETPDLGSVAVKGDARGWKKIRIQKQNGKYLLQYADLDDTTFQEIEISKNANYNFTFFSFDSNAVVDVEPKKEKWDVCFTVFTNEIPDYGTYVYSDFIVSNNLQNVKAYEVSTDDFTFEDFTKADIIESDFNTSQRAIGSSWRVGGGPGMSPQVKTNKFYILKDTEGRNYKVKFLSLTNIEGERGNTQFEYTLLE